MHELTPLSFPACTPFSTPALPPFSSSAPSPKSNIKSSIYSHLNHIWVFNSILTYRLLIGCYNDQYKADLCGGQALDMHRLIFAVRQSFNRKSSTDNFNWTGENQSTKIHHRWHYNLKTQNLPISCKNNRNYTTFCSQVF